MVALLCEKETNSRRKLCPRNTVFFNIKVFGRDKTDQDGTNYNSADYFWGWGWEGREAAGDIPKFAGTLPTITEITRAFFQLLLAKIRMVLQLSRASKSLPLIVW